MIKFIVYSIDSDRVEGSAESIPSNPDFYVTGLIRLSGWEIAGGNLSNLGFWYNQTGVELDPDVIRDTKFSELTLPANQWPALRAQLEEIINDSIVLTPEQIMNVIEAINGLSTVAELKTFLRKLVKYIYLLSRRVE